MRSKTGGGQSKWVSPHPDNGKTPPSKGMDHFSISWALGENFGPGAKKTGVGEPKIAFGLEDAQDISGHMNEDLRPRTPRKLSARWTMSNAPGAKGNALGQICEKLRWFRAGQRYFGNFLQLDEYQVHQVNLAVLSFKREFRMNCPLISWPVHRRSVTAHDSRNSGASTSPPNCVEWTPSKSLRQSISPEYQNMGIEVFFRSLISPSEARSVSKQKLRGYEFHSRGHSLEVRLTVLVEFVAYSTIDWWRERSEDSAHLQSRCTDFRLTVKQLSGTCDTNIGALNSLFWKECQAGTTGMSMWSFYIQHVWNTLKQRKYRYRHLLAMACLHRLAHVSVRSSAPLPCWMHQSCAQQKAKRQASGG